MELKVYPGYTALSDAAADETIELIKGKPNAVICFASGDTPRLTCQLLVQKAKSQQVDTGKIVFIGLDEWVGIPLSNEGSCHYFFRHEVFEPLSLLPAQTHLFDAMSNNLDNECRKMDTIIAKNGGIDLMIVGIGMNGHIGFNEPGVSFHNYSHVIDLDETTLMVGQKYFKTTVALQQGITLGLQHLLESRKAILIANGNKKAEVIKKTVEGKVTNKFPASIMQIHLNGFVMVDEGAASLLNKK
ncbi:glucosamine-6-phosphate deaminase [Terrimonas alba]|uniref:glucosamine-6-phosphate deaminase n=1 Tax=Terrimonas alba TaxID=3349636 RepID=UPI0035F2B039